MSKEKAVRSIQHLYFLKFYEIEVKYDFTSHDITKIQFERNFSNE